jgi:hypothetical protein
MCGDPVWVQCRAWSLSGFLLILLECIWCALMSDVIRRPLTPESGVSIYITESPIGYSNVLKRNVGVIGFTTVRCGIHIDSCQLPSSTLYDYYTIR